jgi:hypothetical protein
MKKKSQTALNAEWCVLELVGLLSAQSRLTKRVRLAMADLLYQAYLGSVYSNFEPDVYPFADNLDDGILCHQIADWLVRGCGLDAPTDAELREKWYPQ